MDCCDIGSVKDLMKVTLETLDEDQIAYVMLETLKGLAYLHHIKVLHLDVKSANILLTKEGLFDYHHIYYWLFVFVYLFIFDCVFYFFKNKVL